MDNLRNIYNKKLADYQTDFNWILASCVPEKKNVLDIGCSVGGLGNYLIKNKHNIVYGIDISSKAIKLASKVLHKTACINIETDNIPFNELFDVVILGDILEHLYDPTSVLKKIKKNLKKNGLIICSIPNIANIEIRIKLLFGKFDYTAFGILDESHIRFFTLKTMKRMFKKSGLVIKKIDYLPFPFCSIFSKMLNININLSRKINYYLSSIRPTLFARQFIIVAELL